ncbi:MAG: alpha-amylase family protein [Phaeodactylibacter sp.]|nr:alpha-amylase family protein [Phaeodactylibacter sp.]
MIKYLSFLTAALLITIGSCTSDNMQQEETTETQERKIVVYQVFTRLFGNTNTTNKPWGTIEENGVGKFSDFTGTALDSIRALGVTHIWYTGVPHHAVIRDYTAYGISEDDPDVVKGRAGSPYAVKDYYNVNPDLADDPARRLEEFKALIERTHRHGLKVLIDIVPNHVARRYEGLNNPEGVEDFGAGDDTSVEYRRDNNFYYIPGEPFRVPDFPDDYQPLGGEPHPLADGQFDENPAKWTGNGARKAQPDFNDWYETVKVNYGIRPDGTKDFPELPEGFDKKDYQAHYAFWQDKNVPDSWKKFRDIALYWTDMGVDGFRFDMAEMVPVEFWSYLNSAVKMKKTDAFLLAEIYNPAAYRDYIHLGKMDYLYDKVELYDTLKNIMQGHGSTDNLPPIQEGLADIEHHMLHFLENHDEQRIASPPFAGDARKGKPAMVVSATISTSPTMIYFGQEVGEPGAEEPGFGGPSRTSIFDYVGVPHHQRWMNDGAFDGGQLAPEEKALRDFYRRLLNFTLNSPALMGEYREIHDHNREQTEGYGHRVFSFVRWSVSEKLIIATNFDAEKAYEFNLKIPANVIAAWGLADGEYELAEQLYGEKNASLKMADGKGEVEVRLAPLESVIWKVGG